MEELGCKPRTEVGAGKLIHSQNSYLWFAFWTFNSLRLTIYKRNEMVDHVITSYSHSQYQRQNAGRAQTTLKF